MRKACLSMRWCDKALGHRMDDAAESVLEFATALDPQANRYKLRNMGMRYPELTTWREDVRYFRTGEIEPTRVASCVAEARASVDEILFALWADGRIEIGMLR